MGNHLLTIHGYHVTCDDDMAYHGLKYLAYTMSEEDVLNLFKQTQAEKEVEFQDDQQRKFTLTAGPNETFVVVATHVSHGWI